MRSSPEAQAVGRLRDIFYRQENFRAQHACFTQDTAQFAEITNRDYDYAYVMLPETTNDNSCVAKYAVTASPVVRNKKSRWYFFMDETGMVRFDKTQPATSASPILHSSPILH
jgi:hypothetical protein